ncbi:MAG: hypothetical protein H0U49_01190 [Parachlamydiaceae bacterium]|nr:hypothetical protein [Parachlamydiaceae bacterium]
MMSSKQLSINSNIKVIITLYNNLESLSCVEDILLESFLQVLKRTKLLSANVTPLLQKKLPKLAEVALKSKASGRIPIKGLFFAMEVHRLNIFDTESSGTIDIDVVQETVKEIHRLLINQTDLSQYSENEKFDALSDFMQYYDLQSVPALKSSIKRRIVKISDPNCLTSVRQELIKLICGLIASEKAWIERFFIIEAITKLAQTVANDEFEKMLVLFLNSHSLCTKKERVDFYIDQLKVNEPLHQLKVNEHLHQPWVFELLIVLLCDSDQDEYAAVHYIDCTQHLLRFNLQKGLSKSITSLISKSYLKQLENRKLWNEILSIYTAQPCIIQGWTSFSATMFIKAFSNSLLNVDCPLNELQIRAQQLLKDLPVNVELSTESTIARSSLAEHFHLSCMQNNNFVEAFQWSEKLTSSGKPYKQDVDLFEKLAENGNLLELKSLMSSLFLKEGNPDTWLKLFYILIKTCQITPCVELFESHKCLPGTNEMFFRDEWFAKIPELLVQCRKLAIDLGSNPQSQGFFEITHQLLSWCNPESKFWLEYIKDIVPIAPISVVEKVLDLLANQNEKLLDISHHDQVLCWKLVLEKLEKFGSMRFLHPMNWWPSVWKKFSIESKESHAQLVYGLVNGSARAISPQPLHLERSSLTEQENEIVNGLKEVFKILEPDDVIAFLHLKEKMASVSLAFNFSKICWFSEMSERKSFALSRLLETCTLFGDDAHDEQCTVQLFNTFMQTLHKCKNPDDIVMIIALINRIKKSGYFDIADHFNILRVLKEIFTNKYNMYSENIPMSSEQIFKKAEPHLLNCVSITIRAILKNSTLNIDVKPLEKELVRWGMEEICKSGLFLGWELVVWSLDKKELSLYLDNGRIKKLNDHKTDLQAYIVIIKLVQLYNRAIKHKYSITELFERRQILNTQELGHRFHLQYGEKKAIKKAFKESTLFLVAVASIVTIAYLIFANLNISKNSG